MSNRKIWDVINEGGEGYRPTAKHVRSAAEINSDLSDAKSKFENAKADLQYNQNDDAAAARVKNLPAKIAALETEIKGA